LAQLLLILQLFDSQSHQAPQLLPVFWCLEAAGEPLQFGVGHVPSYASVGKAADISSHYEIEEEA
jgi:hypothetical protein